MTALFAALLFAAAQTQPTPGGAEVAPPGASPADASPADAPPSADASPTDAAAPGASPADTKSDGGAPSIEPGAGLAAAAPSIGFADHLFLDGDWYRAITEYRRFLYDVKGRGPLAERAAMAIGEALARGEQWDAAGRQLDGVAQRAASQDLRSAALFSAGRAYLLDSRPELAKPRFRLLVEEDGTEPRLRLQSTWLLAWGHFDAGELGEARAYFQKLVDEKGPYAEDAAGVVAALDARDDVNLKNPLLAGVLSLIPGMGHLYLGQVGVGLTSFVWNGVFIAGAVAAFLTGDYALAIVLSVFELGWYSGGIFGAVAGAVRHNRDAVKNWRDDVLVRYGQSRELPTMHEVERAPPGSLVRFTGTF